MAKTLKQLKVDEKRKKQKIAKLKRDLAKEEGLLKRIAAQIPAAKKREDAARKKKAAAKKKKKKGGAKKKKRRPAKRRK